MEARPFRAAILAASLLSLGASHRTANFIVTAPTPELAADIGQAAERYRRDLSVEWIGEAMPNWSRPCTITAQVGAMGAGGATSFVFNQGEVFGWEMNIQGSRERILDSVLPHEVTHTIFASHFRQPLPRWADEGACTTVEHHSERAKQQNMLIRFLQTGRGIPFSQMFAMKEYPRDILPLYAQGYSLARFLINQGGKRTFLAYLADGLNDEQWVRVTREHYGYASLGELQNAWLDWVRRGSLEQTTPIEPGEQLASTVAAVDRAARPTPNLIYRAQNAAAPAAAPLAGKLVPVRRSETARANPQDGWRSIDGAPRANLARASSPWPAAAPPATTSSPYSAPADGPVRNHVTRPQSPESSGQVILEWDRDAPASRSSSASASYDAFLPAQGVIRR